jgi:hypothetical protein
MMNDDDLKRRLTATSLSSPGITLDQVRQRATAGVGRRRSSGIVRLALATAVVWAMVWMAQAAVDRSVNAVAPMGQAVSQPVLRPSGIAQRGRLLQELMADGGWSEVGARAQQGVAPSSPAGSGMRQGRSGQTRLRRWS